MTGRKRAGALGEAGCLPLLDCENHWCWRQYMAEAIAGAMDLEAMGVVGVYLFGSVDRGDCGPGSDIDLLVHFDGGERERALLDAWLEGWNGLLSQMNTLRTGYHVDRMLDVHLFTDRDLSEGNAFAVMICSSREPVSCLRLRFSNISRYEADNSNILTEIA